MPGLAPAHKSVSRLYKLLISFALSISTFFNFFNLLSNLFLLVTVVYHTNMHTYTYIFAFVIIAYVKTTKQVLGKRIYSTSRALSLSSKLIPFAKLNVPVVVKEIVHIREIKYKYLVK